MGMIGRIKSGTKRKTMIGEIKILGAKIHETIEMTTSRGMTRTKAGIETITSPGIRKTHVKTRDATTGIGVTVIGTRKEIMDSNAWERDRRPLEAPDSRKRDAPDSRYSDDRRPPERARPRPAPASNRRQSDP